MASPKKLMVVVGATGLQGSSVATTFLTLPHWQVRCVTRNPSSEKATDLASRGAEVVQADLSDLVSLTRAFENANAIFLNTDFWETWQSLRAAGVDPGTCSQKAYDEIVLQGRNAAIAAASVPTLERLVYSTLTSAKIGSKGKYPDSLHSNSKQDILDYITSEQLELSKKTSLLILGAYFTNALLSPKLDPRTGRYTAVYPQGEYTRMPIVDPTEVTGPFTRALVEDEEPGTRLLAYNSNSYLSMQDALALWSKKTKKEASIVRLAGQEMSSTLGLPTEFTHMFAFIAEFGYTAGLDHVIEPSQLKTAVQTVSYEEWLNRKDAEDLLAEASKSAM